MFLEHALALLESGNFTTRQNPPICYLQFSIIVTLKTFMTFGLGISKNNYDMLSNKEVTTQYNGHPHLPSAVYNVGCQCSWTTLFHTESLIGLMGPHLRLFLILNTLPLVKSVLKEIVLIALLQNESWNKYLMLRVVGQDPNSGRRYLLPLDGAAYLKYWPLWGSYFSDEVSGKSTLF